MGLMLRRTIYCVRCNMSRSLLLRLIVEAWPSLDRDQGCGSGTDQSAFIYVSHEMPEVITDNAARNLRILLRAESIIVDIRFQQTITRSSLRSAPALLGAFAFLMGNVSLFFVLQQAGARSGRRL